MGRLLLYGLLIVGAFTALTGGTGMLRDLAQKGAASVIDGLSSEELREQVLAYYKSDIVKGTVDFYVKNLETIISDINDDGKKDVIAIVDSDATCGSGGCIASIFLEDESGTLHAIPFSVAVKHIEVLTSSTNGMHDLRINHDETTRMIWDGQTYILELI